MSLQPDAGALRSYLAALAAAVAAVTLAAGAVRAAPLDPPPGMKVERIVMLFRHGVRAPIDGEAAAAAYADQPWPVWTTPAEALTAHGREAMRLEGRFDRALFARQGLLPAKGCPAEGSVSLWTNTAERTIESGAGLAEGLAPGCALVVGHLAPGQNDPLFDPTASAPFDDQAALASIQASTGGLDRLVQSQRAAFGVLEDILGCREPDDAKACDLAALPSTLAASPNGRGVNLSGPIHLASGTAQVLLLEYAEGLPLEQVGWGRATPAAIAEIASLHALQIEVLYRPPYMARRWAWAMGPKLAGLLDGEDAAGGGRVSLLVGHDDNIAAVSNLLGLHVSLPGYGEDDPPPGGALGFQVLRQRATGRRYVRVFYQAQSLGQLRALSPLSLSQPPLIQTLHPACARGRSGLCTIAAAQALLRPN